MRRHVLQDIPFPAEVLHELTGELNRIPLNAADTGDVMLVNLGQHVVQAVAELMEQGNHIVMRQQRGTTILLRPKVTHHVSDRRLQRASIGPAPARPNIIHPGATAFAIPSRRVKVKMADDFAVFRDSEELDCRVPYRSLIPSDINPKQRLDHFK